MIKTWKEPADIIALSLLLLLMGCSRAPTLPQSEPDVSAHDADVETCVACGMVVREQPAPRGQIIHRDGTRVFLCSLGDMLRYLEVPSPLGKPQAIYSETMTADHALENMDRAWKPWNLASDLLFVVNIDRPGVMGAPVMAYETRDAAERAAENSSGEVVSFAALQERFAE